MPQVTGKHYDPERYIPPRKKRELPPVKIQPPLTPMIDVIFQLLIFFLLTANFRQAEGQIPSTLPRMAGLASAGSVVPEEPIHIEIIQAYAADQQSVSYAMDGLSLKTPEDLYQALTARKAKVGAVPVVIEPHGDVAWRFVLEAFNQAVRAQFQKVGLTRAR